MPIARFLAGSIAASLLLSGCWWGPPLAQALRTYAGDAPGALTPSSGGDGGTPVPGGDPPDERFPAILDPDEPFPVGGQTGPLRLVSLSVGSSAGFAGDGGAVATALFSAPSGVAWGRAGLVVADTGNQRIRLVDVEANIRTIAGTGAAGDDGDGPDATTLALHGPSRVAIDAAGNVFFADSGNRLVRCVDPTGRLLTVAGGGSAIPDGDAIPATDARLEDPRGLAFGPDGALYIADAGSGKVLVWSAGRLKARTGSFQRPADLAVSRDGTLAVTDAGAGAVWKISATGQSELVAGPDRLSGAAGVAFGDTGELYVADPAAGRVLRFGTDGSVAVAAGTTASALAAGPRGQLFLADPAAHRLQALTGE